MNARPEEAVDVEPEEPFDVEVEILAIRSYVDDTDEIRNQVHDRLVDVQKHIAPQLGGHVEEGLWYQKVLEPPEEGKHLRPEILFFAEDRMRVYFEVTQRVWDRIFEAVGLNDETMRYIVRDIHNRQTTTDFEADDWPECLVDDGSATEAGMLVVKKPVAFRDGENSTRHHLWLLIEHGVDPEKALDYYMVAHQGLGLEQWARTRNVEQSVIEANVQHVANRFRRPVGGERDE